MLQMSILLSIKSTAFKTMCPNNDLVSTIPKMWERISLTVSLYFIFHLLDYLTNVSRRR